MEPRDRTVRAWAAGLRARSHHTARSYQEAVERFLAAVGKPVEEVSVQDALAYAGELSQSGLSRASVAHHISAVRSFLRHCQGLGIMPTSPLDALRRPTVAITSMSRYLTTQGGGPKTALRSPPGGARRPRCRGHPDGDGAAGSGASGGPMAAHLSRPAGQPGPVGGGQGRQTVVPRGTWVILLVGLAAPGGRRPPTDRLAANVPPPTLRSIGFYQEGGWSGQRESDPRSLLGREMCHHNTLAAHSRPSRVAVARA